jgi:glutamate-1-semialdehyde 2,1-aminomutase
MEARAAALAEALHGLIDRHRLAWSVTRLGARMELQFCPEAPGDAAAARAAMEPRIEAALHLWLLNRGLVITPFHNMLLVAPQIEAADTDRLVRAIADFIDACR